MALNDPRIWEDERLETVEGPQEARGMRQMHQLEAWAKEL